MIDFIKFRFVAAPEKILFQSGLEFTAPVSLQTGQIQTPRYGYLKQTATFEGLELNYIQNLDSKTYYFELSGSIHKYYHKGSNYSDYNLCELSTTIENICKLFSIDPNETKVHRLEFGVNIATDYSTNNILNSIICYKGKPFELREFKGNGYFKRFALSQYDIKVYNKALQYGLNDNILRFEVKVNRMDYLLKKGVQIVSIADLLKPKVHSQLRTILENTISNLLFIDFRLNLKLVVSQKEKEVLLEGSNPTFWNNYRMNHSKKGYKIKVHRFKELVIKYTPSNLQNEFKEMILAKWDLLISTPLLPSVVNRKVPQYDIHRVGKIEELNKRYCLTCKREITKQKKGSQYCSEKLNGREVKKCRNEVSNLKQHENRFYKGPTLFDVDLYLKPYYQQIKTILKCS